MRHIFVTAALLGTLAACGGGSSSTPTTPVVQPTPSGVILFGRSGFAPFTTTQSSPTTWSVSAAGVDGPFTSDESGYLGSFTVTTSGPCISASPSTFPTGGGFLLKATGLICVFDGHIETVTVKDSAGNEVVEYGRVI